MRRVIQINVIINNTILAILIPQVDEIIQHGFQCNISTMIKYVAFIRYWRRDGSGRMDD
jgi:hypothetical protein